MRRRWAIGLASCATLMAAATMMDAARALEDAAHQQLWLLPGLYLIEVVALAGLALIAVLIARPRVLTAAWAAMGALSALTLLGAMTIGPFIGLSEVLLVPALVIGDERRCGSVAPRVAAFVAGLVSQAAAMLIAVRMMIR